MMEGMQHRTMVWVKDPIVASALSSPVKPLSKRRLPSSTSVAASATGAYSPGRSRANGKPFGPTKNSAPATTPSTGWGWTKACIISNTIVSSETSQRKMLSGVGAHAPSTPLPRSSGGHMVLLITDSASEHNNCTIKVASAAASDGVVMANEFVTSSTCSTSNECSPDSRGSDKENDAHSKSSGRSHHSANFRRGKSRHSSQLQSTTNRHQNSPVANMSSLEPQPIHVDLLPPDDLITLTHLHEPAVVYCLQQRYSQDIIYTATGPILLALNPFKDCQQLYGEDVMKLYWERGEEIARGTDHSRNVARKKKNVSTPRRSMGKPHNQRLDIEEVGDDIARKKIAPHVYAVADESFRSMMRILEDASDGMGRKPSSSSVSSSNISEAMSCADQSILVSGESGAGKTVTTKIIMQYLAVLSRRSVSAAVNRHVCAKFSQKALPSGGPDPNHREASPSPPPSPTSTENTEQQVLESNPILESFGNARTIRNDNSSRFGKFIEIQFTLIGSLIGAHVDTYLLEKVRLISQSPGERNYHIFYEIFAGTSTSLRKSLFIDGMSPEDFKMTSSSGTYHRRDGVKDKNTFRDLIHAMRTMGFTKDEQNGSLTTVCALLHTSNLTFTEINADESRLDMSNAFLGPASALLGVSAEDLDRALCFCTMDISAAQETLTKKLSMERATKALQALIKATYGALFTFLVQRINSLIACKNNDSKRGGKAAFVGVLDIFGFESFEENSFEQLCINYCNEALQQQFNRFVFKLEQQEYQREGITWSFISFPDNQDVLDLIDAKRTGILSILDDLCLLSKNTDATFAVAAYKKCASHPRFDSTRKQKAQGLFAIHHYAGVVEYSTQSFLEKNKDELPREATDLLLGSSNHFIQLLGYILSKPQQASKISSSNEGENGALGFSRSSVARRGKSSLVRVSLGGQFCQQLRLLRKRIDDTSPHYVRCLKPNDDLVPNRFDPAVIVDQLRCGGVLEAIRVSRVGYPHRYMHEHFIQRYRVLAMNELSELDRRTHPGRVGNKCEVVVNAIACHIINDSLQGQNHLGVASEVMVYPNSSSTGRKLQSSDLIKIGIQMGKSKVFLRRPAFDAMEGLRTQKRVTAATMISSVVRMFLFRLDLLRGLPERAVPVKEKSPEVKKTRNSGFFESSFEASLAIARHHCILPSPKERRSRLKPFKWVLQDGRWVKNHEF